MVRQKISSILHPTWYWVPGTKLVADRHRHVTPRTSTLVSTLQLYRSLRYGNETSSRYLTKQWLVTRRKAVSDGKKLYWYLRIWYVLREDPGMRSPENNMLQSVVLCWYRVKLYTRTTLPTIHSAMIPNKKLQVPFYPVRFPALLSSDQGVLTTYQMSDLISSHPNTGHPLKALLQQKGGKIRLWLTP